MIQLEAELVMVLNVECTSFYDVGETQQGYLRVIPIIGGDVQGKVKGKVISGGADWNRDLGRGYSHVFAKYMIQTDDGAYISIENEGLIDQSDEGSRIKTRPKFEVSKDSKYEWLNYGVYVGSLEAGSVKDSVLIHIYKLL